MSSSFPKVKGFKKDKRNLMESTNNLVVFGQAQTPQEVLTGNKGRRLLRRGSLRHRRSSKPKSILPLGPRSTTQKLDKIFQRVDLTNYFDNTKPWNDPINKKLSQANFAAANCAIGTVGSASSLQMMQQQTLAILPEKSPSPVVATRSPSLIFVKDIVCPICQKGFEPLHFSTVPVADVMKHSLQAYQQQNETIFKKTLEEGWGASAKPKCMMEPQDVVVASNCGELFHRLCLRDWCSRGHRKSPRSSKPVAICPSCGKELKYTMCQEIESIRCFSKEHTLLAKEFIKVKHVNKELQILWPETNNYLARIKREIQETETLYDELRSKRRIVKTELKKLTTDDLSIVMAKVTDTNTLKTSLAKQERALAFMQQETLQIMRMYLLTILRKLKDCPVPIPSSGDFTDVPEYVALTGRIPLSLVPFLQNIMNDNEALASLSRILIPLQGEDVGDAKQRFLEMELIRKFATPQSPPDVTRPNTYVVNSSAPEVGDSDSDDVMIKQLHSSSSIEKKTRVEATSSLKASTATHEIATIPSSSKPEHMLRVLATSDLSVPCKKPPKRLEVLAIADSTVTIPSSLIEPKLMGINISPNGGGSVDNAYDWELKRPNHSCCSDQRTLLDSAAHQGHSSFVDISKMSLDGPSKRLYLYEQDSKYVRAIHQLTKQSPSKVVKAPPGTPQTAATFVTTNNALERPATEPPKKSESPKKEEVINLHNASSPSGSEAASSANSETVQLNDMVIGFMRRQKLNSKLNKNYANDSIQKNCSGASHDKNFRSMTETKNTHSSQTTGFQTSSIPSLNGRPRQPNNAVASSTGHKLVQETEEGSWITLSTDEEDADDDKKVDTRTCSTCSISTLTSLPPKATRFIQPSSYNSSGSTFNVQNVNFPAITGSCEPVYTEGYKKIIKLSPKVQVVESEEYSDSDVGKMTSKQDEVSIAITYIIEDDEDSNGHENTEGNNRAKSSENAEFSGNSDKDENKGINFNVNRALLPPPLPPKKVLSPIYLTAEKSSTYSIITNEGTPVIQTPIKSSSNLFSPWVWPRPSRMIPIDTPSNVHIHGTVDDPTCYASCKNTALIRRSVTSLRLPPLPEEINEMQNRNPKGAVPTLIYENETGMTV